MTSGYMPILTEWLYLKPLCVQALEQTLRRRGRARPHQNLTTIAIAAGVPVCGDRGIANAGASLQSRISGDLAM